MEQLFSLSVAMMAGLLMSRVAKLLKLPAVTAYLVAGILVGPYVLGQLGIAGLGFLSAANVKEYSVFCDVALGFIASFLGVGGGPINVAFLVLFFSMSMKEAAVYSVGTIFFSQLSKLVTMAIGSSIPEVSPTVLISAIICAVAGGILGARMNKKGNEKVIKTVFTVCVAAIAAVDFYNAIA